MSDLTSSLTSRLRSHRLPGLDLGGQLIHPYYDGLSILNIPSSICQWMKVPAFGAGPLAPDLCRPLGESVQRVILILIDALSYHRLVQWLDHTPIWGVFREEGLLAPLTSVVPSTTSSALTTLWTGLSPASHGILGYEMWLKQYGIVANMILHAPMAFKGDVGSLERAGFSPQSFLPAPTLGPHLKRHGVNSYAFNHESIVRSGLSKMILQETEVVPFKTPASLWVDIRQLIENRPHERMYVWTYWSQIDGLSHFHGPDDERVLAEFITYSTAFEKFFWEKLPANLRKNTLILLTADHGQIHTPLNPHHILSNHPELSRHLLINPTGENRMVNLYLRNGREAAVERAFAEAWPGRFNLISQQTALSSGLFGPGPHHPDLENRIGDLLAIAQDGVYLWWSEKKDFLLGRHGGLSPEEMLVPFLAIRF